jgi:hypothetical protein
VERVYCHPTDKLNLPFSFFLAPQSLKLRRTFAAVTLIAFAAVSPVVLAKPPGVSSPSPADLQIDASSLRPIDVQVAAGRDYVIVADAGHVKAYAKNGAPAPMPSVQDIFAAFVAPDDPAKPRTQNLSAHLFENERDPTKICIPCLIEDPVDHRANSTLPPTSSCISELYDVRIGYDGVHGRFWIAAAARNHIWQASNGKRPDGTINPDTSRPECISKLARRFTLAAFSKDQNPADGFPYTHEVTNDYNDWPLETVFGDFAVFTHLNTSKVMEVYDAGRFTKDGWKQRLGLYTPANYETDRLLLVRHHGDSDTMYIAGAKNRNELVLRGFSSSHKGRLLKGPTTKLKHNVPMSDAVFRSNRIHMVGQEGTGIRYLSFPVVTDPNGSIQIRQGATVVNLGNDGPGVRTCLIQDPDAPRDTVYDFPSLEVGEDGDVIVAWRVSGTKNGVPVPTGTRYTVWYHDEPKPRQYAVLQAGSPDSSATKPPTIDFEKGWIDEADQKSMWIAGVAAAADVRDKTGKIIHSPLKVVVGLVTP